MMVSTETRSILAELLQAPSAPAMRECRIVWHVHGMDGGGRWFPEAKRDVLQLWVDIANINYGRESHRLETRNA